MTAILTIFGVKRLVRRGGVACVDDDRALPNVAVGRPRGPARRSVPSASPGSWAGGADSSAPTQLSTSIFQFPVETAHSDARSGCRDDTGSPRRKPHVPCMWSRLARRPTAGAGPSPPTSTRCKVPSFCIGRAFLPWIIRTRYGPQPEEKAACSLHVEAPGGPTHG